jgi:GR25 family glycosyltransferase involved in LPS biosynthesis
MNSIFDKIIFIHCTHRKDRYENIQNFIKKFNLTNYYILEATYLPENGAKGCSHSHYRAMCFAKENNFKNVLILEDDYWIDEDVDIVNKKLEETFKIPKWDVIMLTWGNTSPIERSVQVTDNLRKLTHKKYGWTSTLAYAVNSSFFYILKNDFLRSHNTLSDKYEKSLYFCDMIWRYAQLKYDWFIIYPKIGWEKDEIESLIDINRFQKN